ncbi:retrovirus-related pol polyprotein from transposon TNT 1-94 [Tanacetum coccineum]|uniref:Retrovirus-related pol polyprotein from transposon TNT 1-94 n=1 Tax=Tanacetum coccineum TaxID=301880 RepID=A0ABQ5GS61_9ASTR
MLANGYLRSVENQELGDTMTQNLTEIIYYCLQKILLTRIKWAEKTVPVAEIIAHRDSYDIYSTIDACPECYREMWESQLKVETSNTEIEVNRVKNDENLLWFLKMRNASKKRRLTHNSALILLVQENLQTYNNNLQEQSNVVRARENVGTLVVQKYGIQCYNCKEYGHVSRECQKPKRVKDAAYHKEKMLLCKQEEVGVQFNVVQSMMWKDDTDVELKEQGIGKNIYVHGIVHEVTTDSVEI